MSLPKKYPVIEMSRFGGPEVLIQGERILELPTGNQILIEIKAFGINRPDIFQRKGFYPAPEGVPQNILGLEAAGIVAACGPDVKRFKTGDSVCALLAGGGYASYCLVDSGQALPLVYEKNSLSFVQAAGIPETLFTVWHNVMQLGHLQPGQNFLVHGGSGGIGTTAIKLAVHRGANVYATAGSNSRVEACKNLGATACVNYKNEDFLQSFEDIKFDVILDCVGGDYFAKNLQLLANDGYLVQINAVLGKKVELDLLQMMIHRWHITGSTLRPRDTVFKSSLRETIETEIWDQFFVPQSPLLPEVFQVLPAADIQLAHQAMENGEIFGKIILKF